MNKINKLLEYKFTKYTNENTINVLEHISDKYKVPYERLLKIWNTLNIEFEVKELNKIDTDTESESDSDIEIEFE